MTVDAAALAALAAELPAGTVLGRDDDLSAYERPWRGPAGRAAFVALPADLEQLRTVVRWAVRHRVPLVPQGANTGLVGASVPGPDAVAGVLSTARLAAPLDLHVDDRAVTAAAGVLLSQVQAAAAPHGLELPIDLSSDPSVGGLVATNAGGCRVLRHGDVRHRLLGVQVVLADDDATVLGDLRPLRKKNDAPRLTDLAVGSAGLLGVVTAATLELAHRPVDRATALVLPAGPLPEVATRLERGLGAALGAFELVSGDGAAADRRSTSTAWPTRSRGSRPSWSLLVETEGEDAESILLDVLGDLEDLVADAVVLPPARAWALRHGVSEALALAGPVLGLDVSLPRATLEAVRTECADVVRRRVPGAVLADFGHVGDGGLHLNVVLPPDTDPLAVDKLRTDVYAWWAGTAARSRPSTAWGRPTSAGGRRTSRPPPAATLAAVKRVLDPYGLLGTEALRAAMTQEATP